MVSRPSRSASPSATSSSAGWPSAGKPSPPAALPVYRSDLTRVLSLSLSRGRMGWPWLVGLRGMAGLTRV